MSLRRRQLRILRRIESDLAGSDPGLYALYQGFARRTGGFDLRWVEKVARKRRRFWVFPQRRDERRPGGRMKDWTAGN